MENEIIHFIDDNYIQYSDWYRDNIQKLNQESYAIFECVHSDMLYHIYDAYKVYIRGNINNLDLSIFDKDLLRFFIPNKQILCNCVLDKMNLTQETVHNIWTSIESYCK